MGFLRKSMVAVGRAWYQREFTPPPARAKELVGRMRAVWALATDLAEEVTLGEDCAACAWWSRCGYRDISAIDVTRMGLPRDGGRIIHAHAGILF
jgi:hypothetical protein